MGMTGPKREQQLLTEEEYLALDAASDRPNEFWFGRVYRREGESHDHVLLAAQLLTAFQRRLRKSSWHVVVSLLRVRMDEPRCYAYPDLVVWGDDSLWSDEQNDTLLSPLVLAEIVSPLTKERDQTFKLDFYRRIGSLTDYLLVSPDSVKIEHYARGHNTAWCCRTVLKGDDTVFLAGLRLGIPLREIYAGFEVVNGTIDPVLPFGEEGN
ncbi:hypothetical protein IAD21_04050 [Abditibacteriota bacterium]|nr:hypothetical protein IAD21_04050 [Abditibacteriota bacterium]